MRGFTHRTIQELDVPVRPDRRFAARDLAQVAIFAALIAAFGLIPGINVGVTPVPIVLQTLGVMLAGAVLGPRKGTAAVAVFLVLVAAGLPLLSGGRGGIHYFYATPSSGYLYGWVLGALVIGLLTRPLLPRYPLGLGLLATAAGGIGAVYLCGVPFTAWRMQLPLWTAVLDALKFIPGDIVKVIVAAVVAKQVHRSYPGLMGKR